MCLRVLCVCVVCLRVRVRVRACVRACVRARAAACWRRRVLERGIAGPFKRRPELKIHVRERD